MTLPTSILDSEAALNAVVQAEIDKAVASGASSRDAEVAALNAQITDLKAQIAALSTKPVPPPPPPAPKPTALRTLFGLSGGNVDRSKDASVDIDRRYYSATDVSGFVSDAKRNHAAGKLTWATFKEPHNWADMAAGKGDGWFDDLVSKARGLGFEVWLDIHHEPEGDEPDMSHYKPMQARLAGRLKDGDKGPVKFIVNLTGWDEEFGSYKVADLFPVGSPVFGLAYDSPYLKYGKRLTSKGGPIGSLDTKWTEGTVYVDRLADEAKTLGVKALIGEMGYSDEAFAKDPAWLDRVFTRAAQRGYAAVCYYDTMVNSSRSWALTSTAKRNQYVQAAAKARMVLAV